MARTYLPSQFINENYRFTISNDYYVVHTNNNCYNNYNTTYCDCYNVYPKMDYVSTQAYSCNYNPSNYLVADTFVSDNWYRLDLSNILLIFLILFIFIILFPYKIISRLFGRWLKV